MKKQINKRTHKLDLNEVINDVISVIDVKDKAKKTEMKEVERGKKKAIGYESRGFKSFHYSYALPSDKFEHDGHTFLKRRGVHKFKELSYSTFKKIRGIEKEIKILSKKKENLIKKEILK